ncbi:FAD-binding oxidoreductase [Micromonospora sp. NPDC092111]|uniref:FAD-binding oxidoreductase n=1 Tax=Micromonospora sp. NPDC092111 TaxID=3364289 RepID=UPI00380EAB14
MSDADDLRVALPGRLSAPDAPLLLAALRQLAVDAEPAARAALLTVLGHAYRRYDLLPHAAPIGELAGVDIPTEVIRQAAARAGDGAPWRPAEVVAHDRPCDSVAILTVRPWRRLPYRPGQAVPVNTPRHPGHWRWYSPANNPRPDGTVELHVRAVAAGTVSRSLVHQVRPGELLWLGPPRDTGLHLRDGDLLLAAGGTGLAPLRALVEQVAAAPAGRRVTLVVGARTFVELYDAIALDKLQCAHDWLTIVPTFSHDPHAEPAEQGDAITLAVRHHQPHHQVYACGPPAMVDAARRWLTVAGVPEDRLHLPGPVAW